MEKEVEKNMDDFVFSTIFNIDRLKTRPQNT